MFYYQILIIPIRVIFREYFPNFTNNPEDINLKLQFFYEFEVNKFLK